MSPRRVTIVDIARELGISKSTVANVLNGTGRFSAETDSQVHGAAQRLGYVSNRAARSLRASRIGAIGLYVPRSVRNLSFYMEFAFGAATGAERSGADLMLFSPEPRGPRGFQVDGALVIDPEPADPMVQALLDAGVTVVSVGEFHGAGRERIAGTLQARHRDLQREVFQDLLRRGRRTPVFLGIDHHHAPSWGLDTAENYRQWCREAGLESVLYELPLDLEQDGLDRLLDRIVETPGADAFICAGQGYTRPVLERLLAAGRTPGSDVDLASLAASHDESESGELAAIDLKPHAYGMAAVALLGDLLDGVQAPVHRWFDDAEYRPPST
ncbi:MULTISPECIES: LacI family DNA-binding transcriptional regulator [Arthrobacter]|uniref:LacI family DNA-binding transcriptional regulator n=2 Tax=Arthrobacter TaxID=1663 RepID=A0ABU9KFM8_9MICC|nr:LacI family DNA-binding transcriptional regulator [Arthrobacter sp. YJM1]MDP5225686.1 LacI family DNA-binding transcriptional regulator [Arthrobacter sp. YJM1]